MTIASKRTQSETGPVVTINVSEYFDYQSIREFRAAIINKKKANEDYIVDLTHTRYIDSCALGMLISMDRFVRKHKHSLKVVNCSEHVRKIFSIVHFDKKLIIE